MDRLDLAVVIVTFNTRDLVLQCLQSVCEDADRTKTAGHRAMRGSLHRARRIHPRQRCDSALQSRGHRAGR